MTNQFDRPELILIRWAMMVALDAVTLQSETPSVNREWATQMIFDLSELETKVFKMIETTPPPEGEN